MSVDKKNDAAADPNGVKPDGNPVVRVRLFEKWIGEQFALAKTMLGANHIRVRCRDGIPRMGRIKGKMKKRAWNREGDTVLVISRAIQEEKCGIFRHLKPQTGWLLKTRYLWFFSVTPGHSQDRKN